MLPYLSVSALICLHSCCPLRCVCTEKEACVKWVKLQTRGVALWWTGMSAEVLCTYQALSSLLFWHVGRKLGWKKKEKWRHGKLTAREREGMREGRANGRDLKNIEESLSQPPLTQLMAARRQHVCSVFAPHTLASPCFYVLYFFPSSVAWTMWWNTPTKLHIHTLRTNTKFCLYSRRGIFITKISSLDSPGGALINSHFTPSVLSHREWEYCCCVAVQSVCITFSYSEDTEEYGMK